MSNVITNLHKTEIFQKFILQMDYKWDLERTADVERIKQWREIFDSAYEDINAKSAGQDSGDSYIKCREFICKNW